MFEWDENKNESNYEKHSLRFEETKFVIPDNVYFMGVDNRNNYDEVRYNCYGYLFEREVIISYTIRNGKYRIISFRKCNKREIKEYFK